MKVDEQEPVVEMMEVDKQREMKSEVVEMMEVDKQKDINNDPAAEDAVSVMEEHHSVPPLISRKTKTKKFKPALPIKKAKRAKSVPVEEPPSIPKSDPTPASIKPQRVDATELDVKIDYMNRLATSLAELLLLIESETGSKQEFLERFVNFSKHSSPSEFVKKSLEPLLSTAQLLHSNLKEGLIATDSMKKDQERMQVLENIIFVLIDSRKFLLDYAMSAQLPTTEMEDSGDESDNYVDEVSEEELTPLQYLDKMMQVIQELFINGQPRFGSQRKGTKQTAAAYPKDPFLALAAATGLDPPTIINLSPARQKDFIIKIQNLFPNPMNLIATILENPGSIDFHYLLNGDSDEKSRLKTRIQDLEKFIEFCKEDQLQLLESFLKVKAENDKWRTEIETMLGVHNEGENEWIDED